MQKLQMKISLKKFGSFKKNIYLCKILVKVV